MKAKITVEIRFNDGTFDEKRVLNFHESADWTVVEAEVRRVGLSFSNVLTTVADLETKVGTVITI